MSWFFHGVYNTDFITLTSHQRWLLLRIDISYLSNQTQSASSVRNLVSNTLISINNLIYTCTQPVSNWKSTEKVQSSINCLRVLPLVMLLFSDLKALCFTIVVLSELFCILSIAMTNSMCLNFSCLFRLNYNTEIILCHSQNRYAPLHYALCNIKRICSRNQHPPF